MGVDVKNHALMYGKLQRICLEEMRKGTKISVRITGIRDERQIRVPPNQYSDCKNSM